MTNSRAVRVWTIIAGSLALAVAATTAGAQAYNVQNDGYGNQGEYGNQQGYIDNGYNGQQGYNDGNGGAQGGYQPTAQHLTITNTAPPDIND